MFNRLFKKNGDKQAQIKVCAQGLYRCALLNSRKTMFYESMGIPDTFDGRFDLLLVHIYIINHLLKGYEYYSKLSQALFDCMFADMDQTLREMGVGDVGVPKHMKRMMKAYNGRIQAYDEAFLKDDIELEGALRRNLYGTVDVVDLDLSEMKYYVMSNLDNKTPQRIEKILQGHIVFINQAARKKKDKSSK